MRRSPLFIFAAAVAVILVIGLLAVAALFVYFLYVLGTIDDPYRPAAPFYHYELTVSGLDGFTTENGSAIVMTPLPALNGSPILASGWWANYTPAPGEKRHGMTGLSPANTSMGPMLDVHINMTDYYESYAGVTPMAITPGRNESELPPVVPARVDKPWSFDDVNVIASGYIGALDYPTSAHGRQAVIEFLQAPLMPWQNGPGSMNSTYVYVDPALTPKSNDSALKVHGTLSVMLNHNKVNTSEEGARRFECHTYFIDGTIPAGETGYVPVNVTYSYNISTSGSPPIAM